MNTILNEKNLVERLKKLEKNSNKGTNGTLTVLAGSEKFRGAADLAVGAALRTGVGIVRLVSVEKVVSLVAARHPSAIFFPVNSTSDGMICADTKKIIPETAKKTTAFLVGPGLGQSTDTAAIVSVVAQISEKTVIDADAINLISKNKELLNNFKKPFVITPHVGEMSRLTGICVTDIKKSPEEIASGFSKENKCITVLKDHITFISNENGDVYESRLGNEGLAKGGSGDVLSGLISGFFACGYSGEDAAIIGTVLHGLAADKCAKEKGRRAMLPNDLEEYIIKTLFEFGY